MPYTFTKTKGADNTAEEIREILRLLSGMIPDNATVDGQFLVRRGGYVYMVDVTYCPELSRSPKPKPEPTELETRVRTELTEAAKAVPVRDVDILARVRDGLRRL
jgi:hypothetical protein